MSHKNTMRTLIIHNTSSGFGSDAIFEFERALVSAGDECVLRAIGTKHFPITVIDDADEFDVVVLSGGDGTLARFLWELRGRNIPTCIFPSGTSNLFFANISNAPEPAALAAACRAGRTAKTDLGVISWQTVDNVKTDASFSLMAGSGFDAEVMRRAMPQKHALGEAAYFLAAFSNPAPAHVTFTIELDDETIVRSGVACLVANNALMQADAELVPDCRMDDGILDVIVLDVNLAAQLIKPLIVCLLDRAGHTLRRPHLERFRTKRVRVTPSEPIPMQIDGDICADAIISYEAHVLEGVNCLIVDNMARYQPDPADDALPS